MVRNCTLRCVPGRVKYITFGLPALGYSLFLRSDKVHFSLETSELICTILLANNHFLKILIYTALSYIQKGCNSIGLISGNFEDYQYNR